MLTFLIVGNESLGEGLTNSIDLRNASTTLDANPDVDFGKAIFAEQKNGLLKLELERLGFNLLQRFAVDANDTLEKNAD